MVAKLIGNADGAHNIEGEILTLSAVLVSMAINPAETNAGGTKRDESATGADKVIARSQVYPVAGTPGGPAHSSLSVL